MNQTTKTTKTSKLATLITAILTTTITTTPAFAAKQLTTQHQQKAQQKPQPRYIVTFKNTTKINQAADLSTANQLIEQHGGKVKQQLKSISAIAAELSPAQLKQLKNNPEVQRIEDDPPRYAQAASVPYGIAMVQADLVSDSVAGNQKVCVIDTGYDINHEDLMSGANVTGEVSNTLTATVNLGDWSTDTYGHGTHVAGTIASLNNNVGAQGVAPNGAIKLHIVKVIHKANYWEYWGSDVIAAVEACQTAGATVINMSLAGSKSSAAEQAAIDAAYNSGTLLVGAAGNRGNSAYYYPAAYDSVISVGAVDQAGDAWAYTQTNDQIELVAPGVGVESTLPNNRYGFMDGTSAAAPFVSGVAALVWSHHPQCSNQEIREILQLTAQDKGSSGRDDLYGHGLVQAKAALDLIDANGCDGAADGWLAFFQSYGQLSTFTDINQWQTVWGDVLIQGKNLFDADLPQQPIGVTSLGALKLVNHNLTHVNFMQGVTEVREDLFFNQNDIISYSGLSDLTTVKGTLQIGINDTTTNLTGLESLTFVGEGLNIGYTTELTDISALSNLSSVGTTGYLNSRNLSIFSNPKLQNLTGLEKITEVGNTIRMSNNDLYNVDGLSSLTTVGNHIYLYGNPNLANVDGLANLETVGGDLNLTGTQNLTDLDGLAALTHVGGRLWIHSDNSLLDISGLSNLASVGEEFRINTPSTYTQKPALGSPFCNGVSTTGSGGDITVVYRVGSVDTFATRAEVCQ